MPWISLISCQPFASIDLATYYKTKSETEEFALNMSRQLWTYVRYVSQYSVLFRPLHEQICNHRLSSGTGCFYLAKLQDVGFILSLSAADVQRLTRLSASDVAALHTAIAEAVPHPAPVTGLLAVLELFTAAFCMFLRFCE